MFPTNEEDYYELLDEISGNVIYGDARRCPHHPEVKTSSDNGMFDAPCYKCEGAEMDAWEAWQYDPENPCRPYCDNQVRAIAMPWRFVATCDQVPDEIPF